MDEYEALLERAYELTLQWGLKGNKGLEFIFHSKKHDLVEIYVSAMNADDARIELAKLFGGGDIFGRT